MRNNIPKEEDNFIYQYQKLLNELRILEENYKELRKRQS